MTLSVGTPRIGIAVVGPRPALVHICIRVEGKGNSELTTSSS
jgi:hypothetical protein